MVLKNGTSSQNFLEETKRNMVTRSRRPLMELCVTASLWLLLQRIMDDEPVIKYHAIKQVT